MTKEEQGATLTEKYNKLQADLAGAASWDKELSDFVGVKLSVDPTAEGLSVINQQIQEVQAWKDRISSIQVKILREIARWEALQHQTEKLYKSYLAEFLADESIRSLRNQLLQEAEVARKIPTVIELVSRVELGTKQITGVEKRCRAVRENLDSANGNLSRQISVIQMMIEIGEFKGGVIKHPAKE